MAVWRNSVVAITPGDSSGTESDVSGDVYQVDLRLTRGEVDDTDVGDDHEVIVAGLKSGSLALTLRQNFADNEIDEVLHGIWDSASGRCRVRVRPTNAAISASNPEYSGTWSLVGYDPMTARPGQRREAPVQLRPYSTISRSTS